MITTFSQEHSAAVAELQSTPLFEFPFPEPKPGESTQAYALFRAVSQYRRAVSDGSASLDFYAPDQDLLLESTEDETLRMAERLVFAAIQHRRTPTSERMDFLARAYMPGGEETGDYSSPPAPDDIELDGHTISPRFSFSIGEDGQIQTLEQEDRDREEAAARAYTITESWRLAEDRALALEQSQVVLAALAFISEYGKTEADRLEASNILESIESDHSTQLAQALTR